MASHRRDWRDRPPTGRFSRARQALQQSLRLRLVLVFLLLTLGMAVAFVGGMQKALSVGWRDAARPLVVDYVDRLVADLGTPPSVERAEALARRLPITLHISGPQVNWQSEPASHGSNRERQHDDGLEPNEDDDAADTSLLRRSTADGHRIEFGLSGARGGHQSRRVGLFTLAILLLLTASAYAYVRYLLRPLDDIRAGARRFGAGDFATQIPKRRNDELGTLAADVNTMAQAIHQMLDSKRALLLAISHELRSPLTRARINTELLPETADAQPLREALLRDLAVMRDLITDLLESERLGLGHSALQLESVDLVALAREVVDGAGHTQHAITIQAPNPLPKLNLDRSRMRLLLRNLLDNALRHSSEAALGPIIQITAEGKSVRLSVRDHGPGVPEAVLPHLAEPFYRPDAARARATGGVGLGLYLCKLVALAHGGHWNVRNAQPGLEVTVRLPL